MIETKHRAHHGRLTIPAVLVDNRSPIDCAGSLLPPSAGGTRGIVIIPASESGPIKQNKQTHQTSILLRERPTSFAKFQSRLPPFDVDVDDSTVISSDELNHRRDFSRLIRSSYSICATNDLRTPRSELA